MYVILRDDKRLYQTASYYDVLDTLNLLMIDNPDLEYQLCFQEETVGWFKNKKMKLSKRTEEIVQKLIKEKENEKKS